MTPAKNLGGMATEARFFTALRMTLCDTAAEIGKLFVAKSLLNQQATAETQR